MFTVEFCSLKLHFVLISVVLLHLSQVKSIQLLIVSLET